MKNILRFSQHLAVVGAVIAGSIVGVSRAALALPEPQILEKLNPIPVFAVADDKGFPLIATFQEDDLDSNVTGIFMSRSDANEFVQQLKTEKPEVGDKVQVVLTTLGNIYQFANTEEAKKSELTFEFVPTDEQLSEATKVTKEENFRGVPLFFASVQSEGKEIYLPHADGKIRLFFDVEPLQNQINAFKNKEPEFASTVKINTMPLEVFISLLQDNKLPKADQDLLKEMVLMPSEESMGLINSILEQQEGAGNGNAPAGEKKKKS